MSNWTDEEKQAYDKALCGAELDEARPEDVIMQEKLEALAWRRVTKCLTNPPFCAPKELQHRPKEVTQNTIAGHEYFSKMLRESAYAAGATEDILRSRQQTLRMEIETLRNEIEHDQKVLDEMKRQLEEDKRQIEEDQRRGEQ